MKKCACGNDTFKECSREDSYQTGVRINDDGSHDYEIAGTVEPCGNGTSVLHLECDVCGLIYPESVTTQEELAEERLYEFPVILCGHGRTPAEAWQNAKDGTNMFEWKEVPNHRAVG